MNFSSWLLNWLYDRLFNRLFYWGLLYRWLLYRWLLSRDNRDGDLLSRSFRLNASWLRSRDLRHDHWSRLNCRFFHNCFLLFFNLSHLVLDEVLSVPGAVDTEHAVVEHKADLVALEGLVQLGSDPLDSDDVVEIVDVVAEIVRV